MDGKNYNVKTIEKLINDSKIFKLNPLAQFNLLKRISDKPMYNSKKNKSFLDLIEKIG